MLRVDQVPRYRDMAISVSTDDRRQLLYPLLRMRARERQKSKYYCYWGYNEKLTLHP
jgi:hypothetical protein